MKRFAKFLPTVLNVIGLVTLALCMHFMRRYDGHYVPSMDPASGQTFHPRKTAFRFAVMGDCDVTTDGLEKTIQAIRDDNVDFIICTGDIADKPRDVRHFNWVGERLCKALGPLPFFATPGNHDRESKQRVDDGLDAYKGVFGNPDYWFGYGNTLFVSLNTSREQLCDNAIDFLESVLSDERDEYENLIVFSHVPPLDMRTGKHDCLPDEDAALLAEHLKKYNPTLYLCGHHHSFAQWDFNGIPVMVNPSSGQKNRSTTHGLAYTIVSVNGNRITGIELKELPPLEGRMFAQFFSTRLNISPLFHYLGIVFVLMGCIAHFRLTRRQDGKKTTF